MSERYDVAVIGTGPAGISAAITAKARKKNIILFGNSNLSEKLTKAHQINNYPGMYGMSGEKLAHSFIEHLDAMDIRINSERVTNIAKNGDYYLILTADNNMYEACAVILATGVSFAKTIPGEAELLGRGVSYCATCDAFAYNGKEVAVIGYNSGQESEAVFLTQTASKVYYIPLYKTLSGFNTLENGITDDNISDTNISGNTNNTNAVSAQNNKLCIIKDMPVNIQESNGEQRRLKLKLKNTELEVDGVFVLRDSIKADQLLPGITLRDNHIVVDRQMCTEVEGCFAAGDITGKPYQYIKAAGEGNVAALSAVDYLDKNAINHN